MFLHQCQDLGMDFRRPTLNCIKCIKERWVPEKTQSLQLSTVLDSKKNGASVQDTRPSFLTLRGKEELIIFLLVFLTVESQEFAM